MNFLSSTRNPLSATLFAIGERDEMWKLWKLSFHYSTESGLERRVCVAVVWANSNLIHIETTNDDNPPSTTVELRLFFRTKIAIFVLKLSSSAREPFLMWASTRECGGKKERELQNSQYVSFSDSSTFHHFPPPLRAYPAQRRKTKWEFSIE